MTTMAVVCFGLAAVLAGGLLFACWLIGNLQADADSDRARIESLVDERAQLRAQVAYWKQECVGAQAAADECETSLSDHVAEAIEQAAAGIDVAGISDTDLAVLKAGKEDLTDEQREALDAAYRDLINRLHGGVPYVPGNDDTEES